MTRARDLSNFIGSGSFSSTTFTATAGQTVFTIAHTQGFVQVFMNGLLLDLTVDYTSNGSAITLTSAAVAGDEIEVVKYDAFSVGDAVPASGGTFTGSINTSAGLVTPAGHIVQTVVSEDDQTQSNQVVITSSGTWVNTGNTATITPKFATSKILINIHDPMVGDADEDGHNVYAGWRLYRGTSTVLKTFAYNGSENTTILISRGGQASAGTMSTTHLDSPATTSAVTYKTMVQRNSPSNRELRINWPSTQSMTLMEIAQ